MVLHLSVSHPVHGGVWADTPLGRSPLSKPSTPTSETATAVDGTQPIEMHSCHDTRLQQNDSQFLTSIMIFLLNF